MDEAFKLEVEKEVESRLEEEREKIRAEMVPQEIEMEEEGESEGSEGTTVKDENAVELGNDEDTHGSAPAIFSGQTSPMVKSIV